MYENEEYPDFFGDTPIYSASMVNKNTVVDNSFLQNTIIIEEYIIENVKKDWNVNQTKACTQ